jgi:crotonobetaine/carnitine-CoA ligase
VRGQLIEGADIHRRGPVIDLLEAESARPASPLLRWPGGEWTVEQLADAARRCAQHLRGLGVVEGDRVAIVSGNSAWRLAWQYGTWWIGAVEVSVNAELRGPMLEFVLTDCDPGVVLAEREMLDGLPVPAGATLVVIDEVAVAELEGEDAAALDAVAEQLAPAGLSTILYTSGTTGASKGVMLPRAYFSNLGSVVGRVLDLGEGDAGYFVLPFFHVDAHIVLPAVIQSGSVLSFDRRFSARRWWPQIREFEATWAFVIGAVLSVVMTTEPGPEGTGRLSRFLGAPIPAEAYDYFEDGLGIDILSMFGQTEADGPTFESRDRRRRGSAGWPCAGFDIEIHDPAGTPVAPGEAGEIVIRPQAANMMTLGYWRRDDATVEAWRGLWFHSGDLGKLDADGFLTFVGRLTDSLRRRGENISAYELESVIGTAPGVTECAVIGVLDEMGGEDEIKVFVVPEEPATFEVDAFFAFCEQHLPRYAVPEILQITQSSTFVRSVGTGVIQKRRLPVDVTGQDIYQRGATRAPREDREVAQ